MSKFDNIYESMMNESKDQIERLGYGHKKGDIAKDLKKVEKASKMVSDAQDIIDGIMSKYKISNRGDTDISMNIMDTERDLKTLLKKVK
jgi:hypothetical protein